MFENFKRAGVYPAGSSVQYLSTRQNIILNLDQFQLTASCGSYLKSGDTDRFFSEILNPLRSEDNAETVIDVALPKCMIKAIELPYEPSLTMSDLKEQINWELETLLPDYSPGNYLVNLIRNKADQITSFDSLIIILIEKEVVRQFRKACSEANLIPGKIAHPVVTAAVQASAGDEYSVLIFVEDKFFSFSILKGNKLQTYREQRFDDVLDFAEKLTIVLSSKNSIFQKAGKPCKYIYAGDDTYFEIAGKVALDIGVELNAPDIFRGFVFKNPGDEKKFSQEKLKFCSVAGILI